jgi:hypothetical protein
MLVVFLRACLYLTVPVEIKPHPRQLLFHFFDVSLYQILLKAFTLINGNRTLNSRLNPKRVPAYWVDNIMCTLQLVVSRQNIANSENSCMTYVDAGANGFWELPQDIHFLPLLVFF